MESSENSGILMFCRSWCPDCARARRWLDDNGIPYVEVDVDMDDAARMQAADLNEGRLHTPTFVIGDGVCVDFKPDRIKQLLDLP